jgi:hypothetical protein
VRASSAPFLSKTHPDTHTATPTGPAPQIHRSLPNSSWKAKGIKMPKRQRYMSLKGVDPKFLRNQKYVAKGIRAKIVAAKKA